MVAAGPPRDVVQGDDRTAEGENLPFGAMHCTNAPARTAAQLPDRQPLLGGTR